MRTSGSKVRREAALQRKPAAARESRPKAIICKTGPNDMVDNCLLWLSREVDIEQVPTLAEAMRRCLDREVDVLFVNLSTFTAGELTALAAFRSMKPSSMVVAIARAEMRTALLNAGLADEVFTAYPARRKSQPWV